MFALLETIEVIVAITLTFKFRLLSEVDWYKDIINFKILLMFE